MSIKVYEVGGCVRDKLMGLTPKDIDYAVEAGSWEEMREYIQYHGKIYIEKPEYLTIRAKLPDLGDADFVLCRKDGEYTDGRRPDSVTPGTILDDLARRDFTMNAIAIDTDTGVVIDPHKGQRDISRKLIKCVGKPWDRMLEDPLRMLRAIRFAVTKEFQIHVTIHDVLWHGWRRIESVSEDRVREELARAFKHDTLRTLGWLEVCPDLKAFLFTHVNLRLEPRSYQP